MRYGIFGGGFDPIHLGHLLLAESCRESFALDRILFVPTGVSPHRQSKLAFQASTEHRLEMLELAIGPYEEYSLCHFETDRKETSYTVETLRHLHETLLDPEMFLILGADMFNDLPHWKEPGEILRLAEPIIAQRPGFPPPFFEGLTSLISPTRLDGFRRHVIPMPQFDVSSSRLRTRVREGKSIRFQTPRPVEAYIHSHGLYGAAR